MKKFFIVMVFVLLIPSLSSSKDGSSYSPYFEFSPKSTLRSNLNFAMQQQTTRDSAKIAELQNHPDYILPKKMLLFSALIPGAGELYMGSYLKGAAFFAIEVGVWTMYAVYHKKGIDKEDEFKKYANEYWDEEKYLGWFNNLDSLQQKAFSHQLPETKTQQYYEMIGKYDQFIVGWEDVDFNTPLEDIYDIYNDYREHYMDMRYDSNQLLKRATTGAYLAMFNHIFSAIDAAWTAKKHNSRIIKSAIRMENKRFNSEDLPMLTLKISW